VLLVVQPNDLVYQEACTFIHEGVQEMFDLLGAVRSRDSSLGHVASPPLTRASGIRLRDADSSTPPVGGLRRTVLTPETQRWNAKIQALAVRLEFRHFPALCATGSGLMIAG
jgi:hypothetical protein